MKKEHSKLMDKVLQSLDWDSILEINKVLRDKPLTDDQGKKLEEEATMVGTGTLTPTVGADQNVNTPGYANSKDSASNGSYPTYIG